MWIGRGGVEISYVLYSLPLVGVGRARQSDEVDQVSGRGLSSKRD